MECGTITLQTPKGFSFQLDYYWKSQLKEDGDSRQWPIALVFPGSGFVQMTEREGEPIALALCAKGYQAAVVQYNLLDQGPIYPKAIDVGLTAIDYVSQHAAQIHGAADKVILYGFSAGAHVAALTTAMGLDAAYRQQHGFTNGPLTVAAQVFGYPVIDLGMGFPDTPKTALAICPDQTLWAAQRFVGAHTPPTFIWNTAQDRVVPSQNSLAYATALAQQQVPYELHTFTQGKHGLCLSTIATSRYDHPEDIEGRAASWFKLCDSWVAAQLHMNDVAFTTP